MTPLKWFAGGSERRCEAMTIIDHLLEDINNTPQLTPLKNLLVAREVYEELSIHLTEDCLLWSKVYPSMLFADKQSVFLVGQLTQNQFDSIVFGDEGQGYKLMSIEEFLSSDKVVPQLKERLKDYLKVSD